MSDLQDAVLRSTDGVTLVKLPAFPNNPEAVRLGGQLFVADNPVIGYGATMLNYHAVAVYAINEEGGA